ncbi:MAG: hypothetical protein K8R25_08350 [Methanosarcinales archaeon]|nr:hypothetical protein [Methanosarcinales archaeon]
MNIDKSPSLQEWKNLYKVAIGFKKLAPWNWMCDSDIFGVKDPVSGEIGYCCIMGAIGEHYALGLYLGSEGLYGLSSILSGDFSESKDEALFVQNCLMASFEDRKHLRKQDLRQIKTLGLKFRGRNAWPLFRNYLPGFFPWYLKSDEVRFLTIALLQAMYVSLRFKKDSELLDHPSTNQFFVRVPDKSGENITWEDKWLKPTPLTVGDIPMISIEEATINRLIKARLQREGIWEFDFFYVPTVLQEKEERPYYPYMSLLVDHDSSFILNFQLEKEADCKSTFPVKFADFIERAQVMPDELLVKRLDVYRIMKPISSELGIEINMVESLPALEYAQKSIKKSPVQW